MTPTQALARIMALHQPIDEEAELWGDQDGHDERFPDCPGNCDGHTFTLQVCQECGYEHDGDGARFRGWPCPTYRLAHGDDTEYVPPTIRLQDVTNKALTVEVLRRLEMGHTDGSAVTNSATDEQTEPSDDRALRPDCPT